MAVNIRWERFAANILKGMPKRVAYENAGYSSRGKSAEAAASKLLGNAKFKAIYEGKLKKIEKSAEISKKRVIKEELALSLSDITTLFKPGQWVPLSPTEIPENLRPAISSIEYRETVSGKTVTKEYKYKLWNKGQSLDRLAKLLGYYEPKKKKIMGDEDNPLRVDLSDVPDYILAPMAEKLIEAMTK